MSTYKTLLLPTAYFPPAHFFAAMVHLPVVEIEAWEHYQRQTFRNRCNLYAAGGVENLTVPVERNVRPKTPVRDIRIAWHMPWQIKHFRAIESAYRRSPFYEFYIDDLKSFFEEKPVTLLEHNTRILETLCKLTDIPVRICPTSSYQAGPSPEIWDLRLLAEPSISNNGLPLWFQPEPYEQVFSRRHGFQTNLSILDALFHLGPDTREWLQASIRSPF
jgi:hypothetical protein